MKSTKLERTLKKQLKLATEAHSKELIDVQTSLQQSIKVLEEERKKLQNEVYTLRNTNSELTKTISILQERLNSSNSNLDSIRIAIESNIAVTHQTELEPSWDNRNRFVNTEEVRFLRHIHAKTQHD